MLSNTLELTLRKALDLAASYKHEYATYEHLLLALMDDEDVKLVLIEKRINPKTISKKLITYLKNGLAELVNQNLKESKPTAGFQRIVQRAVLHSQTNGQKTITKNIRETRTGEARFYHTKQVYSELRFKIIGDNF